MPKRLTQEEFILKSKKLHGDKYDYSKVEYKGCNKPVCIICPEHGEFWQRPNTHLNNHGCPLCGVINSTKLQSKEKWAEKAQKVHGDKYDYSKVKYEGWDKKVCIICPKHGEFWQKPSEHIRKNKPSGCPQCGKIYAQTYNLKTTEQFIKDSISVHGNKYDYSKVEYINAKTKVCIICPEHGEFWQEPHAHLKGQGCPKCGSIKRSKSKTLTTDVFIEKAKKMGINKDQIEFGPDYVRMHNFDYSQLRNNFAYSDVLVGPIPHKGKNIDGYSSFLAMAKDNPSEFGCVPGLGHFRRWCHGSEDRDRCHGNAP